MTRAGVAAIALGAIAALAEPAPARPTFVWNASASAPIGLYRVTNAGSLTHGDLVLADPPAAAQQLAAARGYLPFGTPLIKYVAGLRGDRVCALGMKIAVDGHEAALRLIADGEGRPLPTWTGCKVLGADEVFLLNGHVQHSFDGRYFGPVTRSAVLGKLVPLWTF